MLGPTHLPAAAQAFPKARHMAPRSIAADTYTAWRYPVTSLTTMEKTCAGTRGVPSRSGHSLSLMAGSSCRWIRHETWSSARSPLRPWSSCHKTLLAAGGSPDRHLPQLHGVEFQSDRVGSLQFHTYVIHCDPIAPSALGLIEGGIRVREHLPELIA